MSEHVVIVHTDDWERGVRYVINFYEVLGLIYAGVKYYSRDGVGIADYEVYRHLKRERRVSAELYFNNSAGEEFVILIKIFKYPRRERFIILPYMMLDRVVKNDRNMGKGKRNSAS